MITYWMCGLRIPWPTSLKGCNALPVCLGQCTSDSRRPSRTLVGVLSYLEKDMSFQCSICGESHDELPDIGSDKPAQWWDVSEQERDERIELSSDTCVIDGEHFFIRGVIEIPIHDYPERFGFGVWISQKRENFQTYCDNWNSSEIGPFFGWLSTRIAYYKEDTLLLKAMAHFRGEELRPLIIVEPGEHPLAVDQERGISLAKAWEIVHFYVDSN